MDVDGDSEDECGIEGIKIGRDSTINKGGRWSWLFNNQQKPETMKLRGQFDAMQPWPHLRVDHNGKFDCAGGPQQELHLTINKRRRRCDAGGGEGRELPSAWPTRRSTMTITTSMSSGGGPLLQ